MRCMFLAPAAILFERQFFRRIDFIALRQIILALANDADERQ